MASDITVCNIALDLIGSDPINSFDDGNKRSNLCKRNFAHVRDSVLQGHPWNSAMRRAIIPKSTVAPAFQFDNSYPLPEGPTPEKCLRAFAIWENQQWHQQFRVEGRNLLTDAGDPLNLLYIAQIADMESLHPQLRNAIAMSLAVLLVGNLTESGRRIDAIRLQAESAMNAARREDSREGESVPFTATEWIDARL